MNKAIINKQIIIEYNKSVIIILIIKNQIKFSFLLFFFFSDLEIIEFILWKARYSKSK